MVKIRGNSSERKRKAIRSTEKARKARKRE